MSKKKLSILIFSNFYLPGFKGGGPIRTISNMRKTLEGAVEISIFTRDRDLGSNEQYTSINTNCWSEAADGPIFYASPEKFTASGLKEAIGSNLTGV